MTGIVRNHFVLAVHDVRATAAFFCGTLGFRIVHEPPGWVFLARDRCTIMLGECRDAIAPADLGDHAYFGYLLVDDADAMHADAMRSGAKGLGPVMDKPWGLREFTVTTPEGHRLTVGQEIVPSVGKVPSTFAKRWLAAFNAKDLDAIMAHYAEDIEHSSPTVARVLGEPTGIVRGKVALRAYFEKALAAAPADLRYEPLREHVGVAGITLVYHRTGGKIVAETFHFDHDGLVSRAFVAHAEPERAG